MNHTDEEREILEKPLRLSGRATDDIWAMEEIPGYIGLHLDCGDAGTVYLTERQAKEVIWRLQAIISKKPLTLMN